MLSKRCKLADYTSGLVSFLLDFIYIDSVSINCFSMCWNLRATELHTGVLVHPGRYKSWLCVHLKALFTLSPGLCLLEKFVLLVSPCDEEMEKHEPWTRLCSSSCWNFTVRALTKCVCVSVAHLVESSNAQVLSAGVSLLSSNCGEEIKLVIWHLYIFM